MLLGDIMMCIMSPLNPGLMFWQLVPVLAVYSCQCLSYDHISAAIIGWSFHWYCHSIGQLQLSSALHHLRWGRDTGAGWRKFHAKYWPLITQVRPSMSYPEVELKKDQYLIVSLAGGEDVSWDDPWRGRAGWHWWLYLMETMTPELVRMTPWSPCVPGDQWLETWEQPARADQWPCSLGTCDQGCITSTGSAWHTADTCTHWLLSNIMCLHVMWLCLGWDKHLLRSRLQQNIWSVFFQNIFCLPRKYFLIIRPKSLQLQSDDLKIAWLSW